MQPYVDVETIPSKIKLTGEESSIVFDLETTGWKNFYIAFVMLICGLMR